MVTHWLRESFLLAQGFPKVLGSIYSPGGFADLSATLKYGIIQEWKCLPTHVPNKFAYLT